MKSFSRAAVFMLFICLAATHDAFAADSSDRAKAALGSQQGLAGFSKQVRDPAVSAVPSAPGVIVGLADRDGVRFVARGDAGDGEAPDTDTVFEAGSISKGLTGFLLAQMVAAGDVTPGQSVGSLLPAGSSSFLAIVPEEQLALVVLANGGGGVADELARGLLASGR